MNPDDDTPVDPRAWEGWEAPPGVPGTELLDLLAADAADRAAALLAGDSAEPQDPLIDAVRLLAGAASAAHTARAAELTGIPEEELRRLVLGYRHGGAAGAAATRAAAPCGTQELAEAVAEVRHRRAFAVGELLVEAGTITDSGAGVRIRMGPDRRWYPFTLARRQWWPASGASASAGAAYQTAVRARSLRRATG